MQANRCCLPVLTLLVSGCAMPLHVSTLAAPRLTAGDVKVGERYVFDMKPDQSGAGFRYRGKVDRINGGEFVLSDVTVRASLENESFMLDRLFGEPTMVSREAEREIIVERDRIASISFEPESLEP